VLSRFDCVYAGYITQGGAGGALVGCYEPTCQMLLFPYTRYRYIVSVHKYISMTLLEDEKRTRQQFSSVNFLSVHRLMNLVGESEKS
jgi:hypothetical protein